MFEMLGHKRILGFRKKILVNFEYNFRNPPFLAELFSFNNLLKVTSDLA